MKLHPLAEDAFVVEGPTSASNATVFLGPQGALVIDGLASRRDGAALRALIETELRSPVALLLITHYFSDHLGALLELPDTPVIAHAAHAQTFAAEQFRTDEEAALFRPAQLLVHDRLDLAWGRHELLVTHQPGHTRSTLLVDVPTADTVISSDVAIGDIVYLQYAERQGLRRSLEWARARGRARLVQGHGGITTPRRLAAALHYLSVLEAAGRDRTPSRELPLEACLLPGVLPLDFERPFHARNLLLLDQGAVRG